MNQLFRNCYLEPPDVFFPLERCARDVPAGLEGLVFEVAAATVDGESIGANSAKTILPAEVCRTLLTVTGISLPMRLRAWLTTIIVPSGR
jgi:hypothetical protein